MAINNVIIPEPSTPKLKWRKTWWGKTVLAIIVLLIVAIAIFSFRVANFVTQLRKQGLDSITANSSLEKIIQPGPYELNNDSRASIGNKNAKIKIVEFFDFNCPVCKSEYSIVRELAAQYQNDIQIILRHYPVINTSSLSLALASECANEQGLFWNIHDRFFQSSAPAENILAIAKQSGLNMNQFNTCLTDEKYLNKIKEDAAQAQIIGALGTPTWVINGHRIDGAIPKETFKQIIDTLVKNL